MKKIGLFFGTYNPIHNGHLMMANYIVNNTDIDQVLFVVNPTAPFKKKDNLLDFDDRVKLIRLATKNCGKDYCKILPTLIENGLPLPAYTYNTLRSFKEGTENFEYILILGCDNLSKLPKWKNASEIIENHQIYVCPRNGMEYEKQIEDIKNKFNVKNIQVIKDVPECNLSSTFVREQIKEGKDISFYVPDSVRDYIYTKNLYNCMYK